MAEQWTTHFHESFQTNKKTRIVMSGYYRQKDDNGKFDINQQPVVDDS
ncbi:hypothetical protein [Chitinophaga silvatica]|nr:hypothetical protein [Chitinophaga silvatica]